MRLVAARCGTIHVDSGILDGGGGLSGTLRAVPSMCFVIEHPAGIVVWDTTMNPAVCTDALAYWGPLANNITVPEYSERETLTARLAALAIEREQVAYVLNSHLHNDHCGMNRFFPAATVLGRTREHKHAESCVDDPFSGYVREDFMGDGPRIEMFDYEDRHDVFDDGALTLVSTVGHTPGHQSLLVTFASDRQFVLTGDAVYNTDQLAAGAPPGLTWDREAATESSGRLRTFVDAGATVLVAHDPETWAGLDGVKELWREDPQRSAGSRRDGRARTASAWGCSRPTS